MDLATSPTLLGRLRDVEDDDAWERFYDLYSPLIVGFSRQQGCSCAQANDVLQETMMCAMRTLPSFAYDPVRGQFRSYLLRIVDSRIKDAYRRGKRLCLLADGGEAGEEMDVAADSSAEALGEQWDRLWDQNVLLHALTRVKKRVNRRTYRSFDLYVLEGWSVEDVCAETGVSPNTVYQHRARVVRMLRAEVSRLKMELGEE